MQKTSINQFLANEAAQRAAQEKSEYAKQLASGNMISARQSLYEVLQNYCKLPQFNYSVRKKDEEIWCITSSTDRRSLEMSFDSTVLSANFSGGRASHLHRFGYKAISTGANAWNLLWVGDQGVQYSPDELAQSLIVTLAEIMPLN